VLVAFSAGFCEEIVFRSYFLLQFRALTNSAVTAVILQAALFGVAHFYEGPWPVVKISFYGMLFGVVALWRRNLRPGIIAHVWSDVFGIVIMPR